MSEELTEKIDSAIGRLTDQAKAQADSQKSLHLSQAALNLAHVKSVLVGLTIHTKTLTKQKAD